MRKLIIRRETTAAPSSCLKSIADPLLQKIYSVRAIHEDIELERGLEHLLPYHDLKGIDDASAILAAAIRKQEKILVVGDFDADGATSTAVAIRALKSFGANNIDFLVPNRFAYGYGLTPELVVEAVKLNPAIIMTVDNGIANHAGVAAAKAHNIKVVITDHHLPALTLPDADAIVNPNQPGDQFASKNLAGVGVVFYVMLALRRSLHEQGWFQEQNIQLPNMAKLLDIVALGTVADVVPLDRNNRILVHQGLMRIRAGQCVPAIIVLLELSKRDFRRAVATDLGFAVGARLNAAGRLDDMSLGISCLLSEDRASATAIALQLDSLNKERRLIEQSMQLQALSALSLLSDHLQGELPWGLCLYDADWHQGVIGILASRIKDKFYRPVIVFAPGSNGEIKGSARSIPGLHIRDALAKIHAQYPELILKFGGHAMAAGLTIREEMLDDFTQIFDQVVRQSITANELNQIIFSDGSLDQADFNLQLAYLIRDGGPWGQAFPEPIFFFFFTVNEQRIVGEKHLKLTLRKDNQVLNAIAFFVNLDEWPKSNIKTIKAAYRLDINEYRGEENLQLIIDYLEPA